MTTSTASFDPSTLLSYYQAQLPVASASAAPVQSTATASATVNDDPPWENFNQPSTQAKDAQVLSLTNFIDTSNVPLLSTGAADAGTEQDNQKLFSLYQAVNNLSYLASMAQRSGMVTGQLAGLNTRFQSGLQQIQSFISSASFNNLTLQASKPSATVTSTVTMPLQTTGYTGRTIVADANVENALPGVSASDSFSIAIKKGGTTTNVPIDLSQIQGPLTIDAIVSYVNSQLQADGSSTRFQRTMTQGSIDDPTKASYGIAINASPNETVTLSSAAATPALYLAGSSGSPVASTATSVSTDTTTGVTTTSSSTGVDQQARLVKLTNLDGQVQTAFNTTADPTTGSTTASSTVVDGNGNVYVVGNATGNVGQEVNQGSQDVYLSKYDSAGNLQWTKLLGSAGDASATSLTLDPTGGVVVSGSTTADLSTTAIANGNTDSFVARYDADGNQTWTQQIQTLANNQANAVSVDASGNVYIGGQVQGTIGSGQSNSGGTDAYVAKLSAAGKLVYEKQFGTSGNDTVSATATGADGSLYVASVQNGDAVLSKYANGDATSAATWSVDLGDLKGGSVSALAVSNGQVYVSGTTTNTALTAGGQATVAHASSGGQDAFVFGLSDGGATVTPDQVSYVGTSGSDSAGGLSIGPDGSVYLTGTTTGTFAGQVRSVSGTDNAFVTQLSANGLVNWTRQFGGTDGTSSGTAVAVDTQGSSVLDALGLQRGTIDTDESVDLASATTVRAGDSFSIAIQGTAARTATITIDPDETMASLATKISGALNFAGSAKVTYTSAGEALQIKVNAGVTATLVPGPGDFDALGRLGIAAGTLTSASTTPSSTSTSSDTSSSSLTKAVFGLGLPNNIDIATSSDAGLANGQLLGVLDAIRNAYNTTNAPPPSAAPVGNTTGTAPTDLTAQLANYTLGLTLLTGGSSSDSSSSSSVSLTA